MQLDDAALTYLEKFDLLLTYFRKITFNVQGSHCNILSKAVFQRPLPCDCVFHDVK